MTDPTAPSEEAGRFTAGDLAAYLRTPADDHFVVSCFNRAVVLVTHATQTTISEIPPAILDLAIQEVGADLYNRRSTRHGLANFDGPDFTPVRVTRDPMKAAADILAPYLPVPVT